MRAYELRHVKIEGYRGTWYNLTNGRTFNINGEDKEIYLFEHETYGDETANVFATAEGELIMEHVWNGWVDFKKYVLDEQQTDKLIINKVISI